MADRPTPKTCEKNGHVRGPGDKCLFCKTALPRTVLPVDPDDFFARWESLQADARTLLAERAEADRRVAEERAEANKEWAWCAGLLMKAADGTGYDHEAEVHNEALSTLLREMEVDPHNGLPKALAQRVQAMCDRRVAEERSRGDALERASHHLAGRLTELEAELREERTSRVLEERAKERVAVVHHLRSGSKSSDWDEAVREIERGEHRQGTPDRVVDVPGCTCEGSTSTPCPACVRHFDLDRGERRK